MSDAATALTVYLNTKTEVTSLINSPIRPNRLHQNDRSFPAMTIEEFDTDHADNLTGAEGIYASRIRVACYGVTRGSANGLAEAVRGVVQGYRGTMNGVFIHSSQLDAKFSDIIQQRDGTDEPLYRTRLTFRFQVTESVPTYS